MYKLILLGLSLILIGAGCAQTSKSSENSAVVTPAPPAPVSSPVLAPQPMPAPPPTSVGDSSPPTAAQNDEVVKKTAPKPLTPPPPAPAPAPSPPPAPKPPEKPLVISSSAFASGGAIPVEYSCDGTNINPPLSISGVPEGTKSLALIVDDPDAVQVVGYTWTHWTLWNIAPDTKSISAGSVPAGATEGTTSFSSTGYGGPCPPSGTHRYYFRLYALNNTLNLGSGASVSTLKSALTKALIKKTELMGRFTR